MENIGRSLNRVKRSQAWGLRPFTLQSKKTKQTKTLGSWRTIWPLTSDLVTSGWNYSIFVLRNLSTLIHVEKPLDESVNSKKWMNHCDCRFFPQGRSKKQLPNCEIFKWDEVLLRKAPLWISNAARRSSISVATEVPENKRIQNWRGLEVTEVIVHKICTMQPSSWVGLSKKKFNNVYKKKNLKNCPFLCCCPYTWITHCVRAVR